MPSSRKFSLLLTASQAAERLGVSVERVLLWAAEGRLRIAGQDEDGRSLFREHIINTVGENLVALMPSARRLKHQQHDRDDDAHKPRLTCGCKPARSALHLCQTGAALNAALQLAEALAVAMPHDALLRKVAGLCREALTKHLTLPAEVTKNPTGGPATNAAIADFSRLPQIRSEAL